MAEAPETVRDRVHAAAARTSVAGSARVAFGSHLGSPALEECDGEGVVDFSVRLMQVAQQFLPRNLQETFAVPEALTKPRTMLYDGAAALMRTGESWVKLAYGDRHGPRDYSDPSWPFDALRGARDDIIEVGTDPVRDVSATNYRLTVDLVTADERLATGIGVPRGPLRLLRHLPAEVWLDDMERARRIAVQYIAGNRPNWKVVEFWDFGISMTATRPDTNEIADPLDPEDAARIFLEDS